MTAIDPHIMKQINCFIQTLAPLHPQAAYRIAVVEAYNTQKHVFKGMFLVQAPYYLVLSAKDHPFAAVNAGYVMEQLVLYLVSKGFATWMNKKAKEIGLSQTHFVTPNGLDNEAHYTTARELALLLRYCIRTSPKSKEFLKITRTAQYEFTDTTGAYSFSVYNHNAFLQMMDGALTGKTGFTGKAGYCYVGALERDGRLYIVSLLACGWPGNKSYKWADTKKLMNYGLSAYETKKLETPTVPKMSALVIDGVYDWTKQTKSQVKLICPDAPDKYQVLAKDGEKIEIQIRARKELASPVLEDEVCGEVSFWLSEVCLGTYPIYPEQAVDRRAFVWYIMRVLSLLL